MSNDPEYQVLKLYLQEVRQTPLLTATEERELALRTRAGDEDAYHRLIKSNLRFVVNVVKRYRRSGLSFMDLIDEGNVGLCRAARRYNPDLGLRFTSYAVWWIRNTIAMYMAQHGGILSIPVKKYSMVYQIESLNQKLYTILRRAPTPEELARELEISVGEVTSLTVAASQSYVTLENYLSLEEGSRTSNLLSAQGASPVEKHFSMLALRELIEDKMTALSRREREAIELYFGLNNGKPVANFSELGEHLSLSREGARLVFHRAVDRLRDILSGDSWGLWEI